MFGTSSILLLRLASGKAHCYFILPQPLLVEITCTNSDIGTSTGENNLQTLHGPYLAEANGDCPRAYTIASLPYSYTGSVDAGVPDARLSHNCTILQPQS